MKLVISNLGAHDHPAECNFATVQGTCPAGIKRHNVNHSQNARALARHHRAPSSRAHHCAHERLQLAKLANCRELSPNTRARAWYKSSRQVASLAVSLNQHWRRSDPVALFWRFSMETKSNTLVCFCVILFKGGRTNDTPIISTSCKVLRDA